MAEFCEKIKRIRFRQAVTSATGAVTIYLLLVMIPMMSIAVTLVEASRLQGAAESMKEIIDVSAYAALADYDEFVDERFGLLCTSQESTPDALFTDYLNTNAKTIGKSVTVGSATAAGDFALSDTDILRHQILESEGISVPTEAAYNDFDLNVAMDNVGLMTQEVMPLSTSFSISGYATGSAMYFKKTVDAIELADVMTKLPVLYDNALNGGIGGSDIYAATAVSDEATSLIAKMNTFVTRANGKKNVIRLGMTENMLEWFDAMEAIASVNTDAVNFINEVGKKAAEIQSKVNQYLTLPERDRLDKLITYGYGAYNLPNRTNCLQGNSLWGYAYKDAFDAAGGSAASYHNMGGRISNGTSIGTSGGSGGFKGAALEYLAVGAGSEQYNQAYAFYDLLCLRMVLNYNPVLERAESIARKAGAGKNIAFATLLITESYYDVMLLLSGKDVPVYKAHPYMSLARGNLSEKADGVYGIGPIRSYAQNLCDGGFPMGSAASSGLTPDRNDPRESVSDSPITYNEYLMLYMILYGSEQQYMARLQNLIQAEAKKAHAGEYAFSLDQAYTYIDTNVDYSLNPLFGLNGLSGGTGAFPAHREQWFGY